MFSWIIRLTWNAHDPLATGIAAGTMLVLAVWCFFQLRGKSAATVGLALGAHLNLFGLMILAILNLRADVWVAKAYGVTVAEAHKLQPIWIIPVLTLALIAWTAVIITLTKPKDGVLNLINADAISTPARSCSSTQRRVAKRGFRRIERLNGLDVQSCHAGIKARTTRKTRTLFTAKMPRRRG